MKILKPKFWDKKSLSIFPVILLPIAFLYSLIIKLKFFFIRKKNFSIPIICVGNIYIGGTGKTPISIKLFEILKDLKKNPIIIKKNYKNQKDEIKLIEKYCRVLTPEKRIDGIYQAQKRNFDIIILDDGYQDFEIKKNLNIVCFNSKQKLGNGLVIPAGPLRQGLNSLSYCDIILFNGKQDIDFENKLKKFNPKLEFVYYDYISKDIDNFKNDKIIAFAGIGNPGNFFEFLKDNNLNIKKQIEYPDHYYYSKKNLDYLLDLKYKYSAKLLTTEKDYMRIDASNRENFDFVSITPYFRNLDFFKNLIRKNIL